MPSTHPKVLHFRLFDTPYQASALACMNDRLGAILGLRVETHNDHEWDALVSCYAVLQGLTGAWLRDLHVELTDADERLIEFCGASSYFWPEPIREDASLQRRSA